MKLRPIRNYIITLWGVIAVVAGVVGAPRLLAGPPEESIDTLVRRAIEEFQAPGMAVSVVYDGGIYYSAGQGVLEIHKKARVDDATLFQIASLSKAFTAAAMAILVDEGSLGWDDPVIDYLPEFRMYDPWVTREFTIRDLLTHRSGLPLGAGDLLLFPETNTTREEVIRAMRYLKPNTSFRSRYAYDNLLYIIAGEVVAKVAGLPFEEFLEQRLLHPLGMNDCAGSLERADPNAAKATPHVIVDDKLVTTDSFASPLSAAAGGINCSARSMAAWMSFVLNRGLTADGEPLISEAQVDQLLSPVTLLRTGGALSEHTGAFLNAYALGWNVSTFYGQPMYSHGGGLWGMSTYIALLPDLGLGVFASHNQRTSAPLAVVYAIFDEFLSDSTPRGGQDWIKVIYDMTVGRKNAAAETVAEAEESRTKDSSPSLPLDAYAGTYRDPWYGDITITKSDTGDLWFHSERSAPLSGPLEHFQFNTFIARWTDRKLAADAYVSFTLSPDGGIERIKMKAVSPETDFSFDFHDLDLVRVSTD